MPNWPRFNNNIFYPKTTYYTKVYIPSTRVKTLFSVQYNLIQADPGLAIIPLLFHVRKLAGAYTLGASAALDLRISFGLDPLARLANVGYFDQAGEISTVCLGASSLQDANYSRLQPLNQLVGQPVFIAPNNADWTGSGGDLEVTVVFSAIPLIMPFSA